MPPVASVPESPRVFSQTSSTRPPSRLAILIAVLALTGLFVGPATAGVPGPSVSTGPYVSSITPAQGSVVGGERVTINGSGFVGAADACQGGYEIWFGTDLEHGYVITSSSYQVLSDSQISVAVPPNFGGTVNVRVHDLCGTSPIGVGDLFTYQYPSTQCFSRTCSVTVGSSPLGALGHVGLGFLDGFNTDAGVAITSRDAQLVQALSPRQWRFGQYGLNEPGGGLFGLARSAGAKISLDLTSDWEDWAWSNDRPYWQAPYGDLSRYYSFIYSDVKNRLAANEVPDYFDVWNEPVSSGTVNQWLSLYGTAYAAIKAADPSAQVVGPSIGWFLVDSGGQANTPGYDLSLTDFLNWEMKTGVRFAAISWHEDGTTVDAAGAPIWGQPSLPVPGGSRDYWSPAAIANHVSQAKALIASYPALSGTQVFVNEYGPPYAANVPGWMVGDFAALEGAGANEGMLTCVTGSACSNLMDGLIGSDGAPQMPYWVMRAYSQMSGQRVQISASGSNFYVLATRLDSQQTMEALIGRADDCWGGQQCPQFHAPSDGPVQLSLSVTIPWSLKTVNVAVGPLRNSATNQIGSSDVPTAPTPVSMTSLAVHNGAVTVPVGSANDGDAFYVTVTPTRNR